MSAQPPLSGQLREADGPAFHEPWEAQAFATTLLLHQRGLFSWSEWTGALAAQIAAAQARGEPDLGDSYYRHWLAALESIVTVKGMCSGADLQHYRHAWHQAAERTPHGAPIELQPGDFRG